AVKAEARERFDTGLHLFEKGENAGALAEFKRAYQLIPNPVVVYNMGLVYAAMNRPVDALDALTKFLGDPGTAGAEQKKHAEEVRAEQEKRIAQLVVLTDHPATVEVDGVEVGQTPLGRPIRVGSGSHVVAVEAPGFLGSRREVTLAGQITETISMTMQPTDTRMAQLVVSAALPGAEVIVNGKRVGATPLPASVAVPPGKTSVELQRAGYRTSAQTIALDEGAHGELSFTLEEDPAAPASLKGRLVVSSSEPGSDLTVDGGARRPLVGPVLLPVGPHRVRVDKPGYQYAERSVEVVNGQDASLQVTLEPTDETAARLDASRSSRRAAGWTMLLGGAAVAVGGAVFAIVENSSLSTAQSNYDAYHMKYELPGLSCDPTIDPATYVQRGCDTNHAQVQDPVDKAKALRIVGIAVGAVGVASAVIGGYLLGTAGSGASTAASASSGATSLAAWAGGGAGGLVLTGRF
ncbi:MAG TPA: PEGA domain-containing protein, partial [Polyangia bacterium]|nr:PEGA domain-containing protein [Polyangia bacterium]